jgi:hypothetical protein
MSDKDIALLTLPERKKEVEELLPHRYRQILDALHRNEVLSPAALKKHMRFLHETILVECGLSKYIICSTLLPEFNFPWSNNPKMLNLISVSLVLRIRSLERSCNQVRVTEEGHTLMSDTYVGRPIHFPQ